MRENEECQFGGTTRRSRQAEIQHRLRPFPGWLLCLAFVGLDSAQTVPDRGVAVVISAYGMRDCVDNIPYIIGRSSHLPHYILCFSARCHGLRRLPNLHLVPVCMAEAQHVVRHKWRRFCDGMASVMAEGLMTNPPAWRLPARSRLPQNSPVALASRLPESIPRPSLPDAPQAILASLVASWATGQDARITTGCEARTGSAGGRSTYAARSARQSAPRPRPRIT